VNNNAKKLVKMERSLIDALIKQKTIQQDIVETLGVDVGVDRCVLYKIFCDNNVKMCEIIAGIPTDEGEHGIGLKEPVDNGRHADLTEVIKLKNILHIKNPAINKFTSHFTETISKKNISEILYIPLFIGAQEELVGIIVIDMTGARKFTAEEKDYCREAGRKISSTFEHIELLNQKWRDRFVNPIVSMKKFTAHLMGEIENLEKSAIDIIGKSKKKLKYIEDALNQLEAHIPRSGEIFDKPGGRE